jgi:hypothetical protein
MAESHLWSTTARRVAVILPFAGPKHNLEVTFDGLETKARQGSNTNC